MAPVMLTDNKTEGRTALHVRQGEINVLDIPTLDLVCIEVNKP
jgi:hypothetical protein